jgi:hypothetical protein
MRLDLRWPTSGCRRRDLDRPPFTVADAGDFQGHRDGERGQQPVHVVDAGHDAVVDGDDQVIRVDARFFGQAAGGDLDHGHHLVGKQIEVVHEVARQTAQGGDDAELAAPHFAVLEHFRDNPARRVAGDREAQSLREGDDGGVDTADAAARIDERSARVAGVDRRRVLYDVLDEPAVAAAHAATERTDYAGRDGRVQAHRAAHGDNELADAQGGRIANLGVRPIARRQTQQGQVMNPPANIPGGLEEGDRRQKNNRRHLQDFGFLLPANQRLTFGSLRVRSRDELC